MSVVACAQIAWRSHHAAELLRQGASNASGNLIAEEVEDEMMDGALWYAAIKATVADMMSHREGMLRTDVETVRGGEMREDAVRSAKLQGKDGVRKGSRARTAENVAAVMEGVSGLSDLSAGKKGVAERSEEKSVKRSARPSARSGQGREQLRKETLPEWRQPTEPKCFWKRSKGHVAHERARERHLSSR